MTGKNPEGFASVSSVIDAIESTNRKSTIQVRLDMRVVEIRIDENDIQSEDSKFLMETMDDFQAILDHLYSAKFEKTWKDTTTQKSSYSIDTWFPSVQSGVNLYFRINRPNPQIERVSHVESRISKLPSLKVNGQINLRNGAFIRKNPGKVASYTLYISLLTTTQDGLEFSEIKAADHYAHTGSDADLINWAKTRAAAQEVL